MLLGVIIYYSNVKIYNIGSEIMSKYDKVREQIKNDYEVTSKSLRQLAKEYSVPYDTVWTWSKKFNWISDTIKIKDDKRTTSTEIVDKAKKLFENSSLSIKEVSEQLSIPKGTVQSWKQKYNWVKNEKYIKEYKHNINSKFEKSSINDKDVQQIQYLYENTNLSVKEIGEQLNMTADMVRNRINKYGFKRTEEQISRIMSEKQKARWNNYTEQQQKEIRTKMSETNKEVWANRSEDKKQEIIQHRLETINNKSEEELQETKDKISQSVQKTWNNYNKKDRLKINTKLQKIWNNRTPEKREQFKQTMQNTWKMKTEQQIKELEEKRKLCYKNKSKEEINSINNKIHQTKKLKGVYGKSNQEDKLYKELIKEFGEENVERQYTENGFVFDFKIIRPSLNPKHKGELIEQLVEFNGSFFHNFRPFIDCLEHNKEYNEMCNKGLIISRIAHKWKYTDVEKFLYCKLNNKNYTALYFDTNPKPYFTQEELKTSYNQILKQPLKYTNLSTHNEIVENFCYKEIYKDNLQKFKQEDIYKYLVNRIKYANNYGESCSNITLLQLLKDFNKSGSIFNGFTMFPITNIRKFIYDNNVKTIADPFAGWGHRLIGSYSMNCNYIGCDINSTQINNLYSITQLLNQQNNTLFRPNIVLLNNDSLNVDTSLYNYDAIFTCPPYWNKEVYTDIGIENLSYKEFKQKFINIIKKWIIPSVKIIGIQFTEKYEDCIKDLGYKYEKIILNNVTHHFTKNSKKYFECLYIIKL